MRWFIGFVCMVSAPAGATDFADAVEWVHEQDGDAIIPAYNGVEAYAHDDGALAFIHSRDNQHGTDLAKYDCSDSVIDKSVVYKAGFTSKTIRLCLEQKWKQSSLRGFVTLGKVRLQARDVRDWLKQAEMATDVPFVLLDSIIRYSSGYRPGVVSELGHYGLMQLKPELLDQYDIEHGDLLDPQENIRVGALYLRALVFEYKSIKKVLLYYQDGTKPFKANGGRTPRGSRYLWFARHVVKLYKASIRDFPMDLGVDSLVFVWTWLD